MHHRGLLTSLIGLLTAFLLVASMAVASDKPIPAVKDRASIPARFAPAYGFGGIESNVASAKMGVPAMAGQAMATRAVGTQIGSTSYDYQHNCTMGRQAEHRGTDYLHFDWTDQAGYVQGQGRGVSVQSIDLTTCDPVFIAPKRATVDYGGYVTIDAANNGCAIPSAHEGPDADDQWIRAYWDYCAGGPLGSFGSDSPTDVYGWYQNHGIGPTNTNDWPKIDIQYGTETVLHVVVSEFGGALGDPQSCSYYRRVGGYGATVGTWSAQKVIDTIMEISPTVTSSQTTGKVAIVWNAPCDYLRDQGQAIEYRGQYENDIWYAVSTDQGASFFTVTGSIGHGVETGQIGGANITQYDATSTWKAYSDISALITSDNNLHIVWMCRKWTDSTTLFRRQGAIFHWSENVPYVRSVVRAEWDTGGTCYGHAWSSDVAKMSLSECDGKLYVLYTQFGNAAEPCVDINASQQVVNGELYMTVTNDNGLNWDRPQNLTNSRTPNCADGECASDNWASMSRFGRVNTNGCQNGTPGDNVLDILYINDKSAGGCIQTESGVWTTNPVMWLQTPCRDVVAEPGYVDNAGTGYGECYSAVPLVVQPGDDTTVTFRMENTGLRDNSYTITVSPSGTTWITLSTVGGNLPSGLNNFQDVNVTFDAPTGAADPSTHVATIVVTHEAEGSPRNIPVCLVVASDFVYPATVDLATTCKRIRLSNDGHLVNNAAGYALDFAGDCDTFNVNTTANIYLYDGSPIVCRLNGEGAALRFAAYSGTFTATDGLRPLAPWTTDNSNTDYRKVSTFFATADTAIGFFAEYYAPRGAGDCGYIIERLKFFNMTDATLSGVLVGEFVDWDIPADSGSNNGSGYDEARNLIYQFGEERPEDDTIPSCTQQSDQRYGGIAAGPNTPFRSARTVDNATYVYTTGPYGNNAPLPAQAMYDLMDSSEGFGTFSSPDPDSAYVDLSTLVTFGKYDLATTDTICVVKILVTTRTGLNDMLAAVDAARAFLTAHPELDCAALTCCNMPGDANDDGTVNVGDAVFIINYVFKGGDIPACMSEADANADATVNVGDAVFIINYVFKGGDTPVCGSL